MEFSFLYFLKLIYFLLKLCFFIFTYWLNRIPTAIHFEQTTGAKRR